MSPLTHAKRMLNATCAVFAHEVHARILPGARDDLFICTSVENRHRLCRGLTVPGP
jgi:hypothetical protein